MKLNYNEVNEDQEKLLDEIIYFNKKTKPKNKEKNKKNKMLLETCVTFITVEKSH